MIFYKSLVIIGMPCLDRSASMALSSNGRISSLHKTCSIFFICYSFIRLTLLRSFVQVYTEISRRYFRGGLLLALFPYSHYFHCQQPLEPNMQHFLVQQSAHLPLFSQGQHLYPITTILDPIAASEITVSLLLLNLLMSAPCSKRNSIFRLSLFNAAANMGKVALSSFTLA